MVIKMERETILVDMDGVLADYERGFLDEWRKRHPDKSYIPLEERMTFYVRDQYPQEYKGLIGELITSKGFYLNLPVMEFAKEGLEKLSKKYEVLICTSPLSDYKNCVGEKFEWAEKNLGEEWPMKIIVAKDKTLVRGNYLIDDKPDVKGKMKPVWEQIVYKHPFNNGAFTWKDTDNFIRWVEDGE